MLSYYYKSNTICHNPHTASTCWQPRLWPVCVCVQVSKKALWLLAQVEQEPLLNLEQLNPELVKHSDSMAQAHGLRQRLRLLGDYLLTCRSGACKKLQARCVPACVFYILHYFITTFYYSCFCYILCQNGAANVPVGVEPSVQCHWPTTGILLCGLCYCTSHLPPWNVSICACLFFCRWQRANTQCTWWHCCSTPPTTCSTATCALSAASFVRYATLMTSSSPSSLTAPPGMLSCYPPFPHLSNSSPPLLLSICFKSRLTRNNFYYAIFNFHIYFKLKPSYSLTS